MSSKNSKRFFEAKRHNTINFRGNRYAHSKQKLSNFGGLEGGLGECSMDERAVKCCSLRTIIPEVMKSKKPSQQLVKEKSKALSLNELEKNLEKTVQNPNAKDEYMYDLAHFLFKVSDLLLEVSEYEKLRCSKETDLRKMLNIVKSEIMRAFLRGKTKRRTMSKIVTRITYLDKYIQQMNGELCLETLKRTDLYTEEATRFDESLLVTDDKNDTSSLCIEVNEKGKGDCDSIKTKYKLEKSEDKQLIKSTLTKATEIDLDYFLNIKDNITNHENDLEVMQSITLIGDSLPVNSSVRSVCRQCTDDEQSTLVINQPQYCFTSKQQEKVKQQTFIKKSSECINNKLNLFNKLQTIDDGSIKPSNEETKSLCETISVDDSSSARLNEVIAAQFCEQTYDSQYPMKKVSLKVDPEEWVELDSRMKIKAVPISKVNKQISAQKLKKDSSSKTEGKSQTEETFMTENGDHQIISMNVLYSKTHVRYIIPDWMQVMIDTDQTPKVLCKQDLDDGVALTSYQADPDGTIHFTLAYSSEVLCNLLKSKPETGDLVSKLNEIKSIWADSAKILYETLLKEYEEQNTNVTTTNNEHDDKMMNINARAGGMMEQEQSATTLDEDFERNQSLNSYSYTSSVIQH